MQIGHCMKGEFDQIPDRKHLEGRKAYFGPFEAV